MEIVSIPRVGNDDLPPILQQDLQHRNPDPKPCSSLHFIFCFLVLLILQCWFYNGLQSLSQTFACVGVGCWPNRAMQRELVRGLPSSGTRSGGAVLSTSKKPVFLAVFSWLQQSLSLSIEVGSASHCLLPTTKSLPSFKVTLCEAGLSQRGVAKKEEKQRLLQKNTSQRNEHPLLQRRRMVVIS